MTARAQSRRRLTDAAATTIMAASATVILPLVFYFWLWFMSIGGSGRPNAALDIYAAIWSGVALIVAISNFRTTLRIYKGGEASKLPLILLVSVAFVATCPEWFY